VWHLDWQTPKGYLDEFKPNLSHLHILGCGAYIFIHKDLQANKLSPKSELMTFLGYHDGHESNMFMCAPNNIIFTAAMALFDEHLFPKCAKHKVPPVTQIQEPEEPEISIETESVPDDNNSDAPFAPPHNSIILQGDKERSHDDAEPQCPPQLPPQQPRHAPGGAQHGNEPPRCSERERKGTRKDRNIYPPGTSTGTDRCQKLPDANSAMSVPNSGQSRNTVDGDPGHAKSATEGGALWGCLLSKAIPHHDELPDLMNVQDWTSKDIGKLSAEDQWAWHKAQFEELEALKKCNVYKLADIPPGCKAIKNRWVFNLKSDGHKKAHLVAKGFSQVEGLDFDEIFSLVVQFELVCTILVLAVLEKWKIEGLDVKSTFLYGTLDKELYMEQPQGFKVLGADAGIFVDKHADRTMVIILMYVDDIILTGPNAAQVTSKKKIFMDKWECHDLGECREFLHMRIEY